MSEKSAMLNYFLSVAEKKKEQKNWNSKSFYALTVNKDIIKTN